MKSGRAAAPRKSDPSGFGWKAAPSHCHGQNADSKPSSQPLTFCKWHFLVPAGAWSQPSPFPGTLTSAPHSQQRGAGSLLLARGVKPM